MLSNKEKYPIKRLVKFEKLVRETDHETGYYHIPVALNSPDSAYDTIIELTHCDRESQEVFGMISLNTKNKAIGCEIIHKGTVNSSVVSPRDVFKMALIKGAVSIIVFHNHPSGSAIESKEDENVTIRLKKAGEIIGIELLDHIIIGDEGEYTSLKEKGVI